MFYRTVLAFLMIFGIQIVDGKNSVFLFPATKNSEIGSPWATQSPDGKLFAYVCHYTLELCIKEVGAEESTAQVYSKYNGLGYVSWSPDGRQIVFDGDDISTEERGTDLFVLTLATKGVRRLTDSSGVEYEGSWSPDGTKIVYSSQRRSPKGDQYQKADLFLVNMSTLVTEQITDTIDEDEVDPSWSPDGLEVVFVVSDTDNIYQIYRKNLNTGETTQLIKSRLFDSHPVWGVSGKIAFIRIENDPMGTNVYLFDPDTSLTTPVTECKAGHCGVMHAEWHGEKLLITMYGVEDEMTNLYTIWEVSVS